MTRFREEWYATRRYKALARRNASPCLPVEKVETAARALYFQKPRAVRKAIDKAQAQKRLSGF